MKCAAANNNNANNANVNNANDANNNANNNHFNPIIFCLMWNIFITVSETK